MTRDLGRRLLAEALGTAVLVLAVVGSAYLAVRLSPDDVGLQLLEITLATGLTLGALIVVLQPVSGAHLNPAVTFAAAVRRERNPSQSVAYVGAQLVGAVAGAILANSMFTADPLQVATQTRVGWQSLVGEVVATAGLVVVVLGLAASRRAHLVPLGVAAWVVGASWFTPSTSFANPAVTVGRALSDGSAGIAPSSVPPFVAAQLVGAAVAVVLVSTWWPDTPRHPTPEEVP